jgi:hypothetical protein
MRHGWHVPMGRCVLPAPNDPDYERALRELMTDWNPQVWMVEGNIDNPRRIEKELRAKAEWSDAEVIKSAIAHMEQLLRIYSDKLWADEQEVRRASVAATEKAK